MSLADRSLKLCDCNRSMSLDGAAIGKALQAGAPITIHHELCRKEAGQFNEALRSERCVVACTQEAPLFAELARDAATELSFVNIREAAGWSREGAQATPKIAALLALADLPDPEPPAGVTYRSSGQTLVIGPAEVALQWAERFKNDLDVSVLITAGHAGAAELPSERAYPAWSGMVASIKGWLGAFEVTWTQENPIDLDVCTRCNGCIRACPEDAIGFDYQIDPAKCRSHRDCVKACGAVGAIDFSRTDRDRSESFDLVFDLSAEPSLRMPQKPQGYLAPGRDPLEQALAAATLVRLVGEFEKPKFFQYNEKLCAHGRSGKTGCTACIDVCSTQAIVSRGERVEVEPHLCMGCGGCATVCPSGAMTYAAPRVADLGVRIKKLLSVYHSAGGQNAAILFHDAKGAALIAKLARRGPGLPARVIPLEVARVAPIGLDTMLGAVAYGASEVLVLSSRADDDDYDGYDVALEQQMGFGRTILNALGYAGEHLALIRAFEPEALERAVWARKPARTVAKAATFNLSNEKRGTLEFALDHLAKNAPTPKEEIALGRGAPWGRIEVDKSACTLCMACVGACPEKALADSVDTPRLRFIERNCVQCGLCVHTCPEQAISLVPRLLLTPQAKEAVTLNEAEPFNCVRCGKPFGTRQMIDGMRARLGTHSMFAGEGALQRLMMCADCRVIDMMESRSEVSILDVKRS